MKYILCLFVLVFSACGDQPQEAQITVNYLTQDEMQSYGRSWLGWSRFWDDGKCNIYMMYPEVYDDMCHVTRPTDALVCGEDMYMYVLGHEMRHCLEGKFHE